MEVQTRKRRNIRIKIGEKYKSNAYGEVVVIDVKSYKEVFVRFINTGNEQRVGGGSLIKGMIVDQKLFNETKLLYKGKICSTKAFGDVEVISASPKKCVVRFINTGNIQSVEAANLRKGLIKDKAYFSETCEYKVGLIHPTKSYGDVEVIEITNSHNIIVKFVNTGNTTKVSAGNLAKGNVADSKYFEDNYKYKVGDTFKSNNYGSFVILELVNNTKHKVLVRFSDTGSVVKTTISQIKSGTVKDPNSSVFEPKHLGENRFCVYLHKDADGVVRYVGQGLYKRAKAILGRNSKWNELFKENPPLVEYVKENISKAEAEDLEQELISKYSDTIVNKVRTYSGTRDLDYNTFSEVFYVSEESKSGLKFKIRYNNHEAGEDAYDNTSKGYFVVYFNRANYLVHRIVWLLTHGEIARDKVIDHINRKRSDNRLSNLALVDMSHNMRNRTLPLPNSGYRNISMKTYSTGVVSFSVVHTKPLHDSRSKETFSTVKYKDAFDAFIAAYSYRDKLIQEGVLLEVIKQNEKPISEMKNYLLSLKELRNE